MQDYKIRNKDTGMMVTVRGEQPPAEEILPEIFANARKGATQKLSSGDFVLGADRQHLDKQQQREKIKNLSAQAFGMSSDDVDIDSGMSFWERTKLNIQPTDAEKMKQLEDTYGKDGVAMLDVGGTSKMFFRDPKTKKMTMVDEQGASFADFTADIAGEILPTAGAITGGIVGFGAGGPLGSIAGAAAGGALARGAQDITTRALSGEEQQFGEMGGRIAKEAAFGAFFDAATLGTGKFFSRFGGKGLADGFQKGITEASETLRKRGIDVDLTPGMRTGDDAARFESKIAADRPKSKIAGRLAGIRDDLDNFRQQLDGGVDSQEALSKNIEGIRENYRGLIDEVAKTDKEAAKLVQKSLQGKIDRLGSASAKNLDQFGKQLQNIHARSRSVIDQTNAGNFKGLKALADSQGVSVTNREVVKSMRKGLNRFKVLGDENINKLIKEIEDGPEVIGFQELRERLDQVADAVSQSKVAGFSNKEKVASAVGDSMRDLRDKVAARSGKEFSDQFDETMRFYKDEYLSTRRGAVGRSLAEKLGASSTTPQSASRLILSDPENIRQTLRAAEAGGQSPSVVKDQLREAYRASIGLNRGTTAREGFDFNEEVVEELWGKRGVLGLKSLNKAVKRGNKDLGSMTDDEVVDLLSAFSTNERERIAKKIVQKGAAQAEADDLASNALLRKIIKGDIEYFQNEELAGHLIKSNRGDVRKFMAEARKAGDVEGVRQDVVTELFRKAGRNAQKTSDGIDMWNPDTMGKLLSEKGGALKEVLGEKTFNEISAGNKLLKAAESRGSGKAGVAIRGSASGSGAHVFLVGDLFNSAKERFWGWAYGSKSLTGLLTGASKGQMDARMKKALPAMLGSSQGVQALARTTKEDPELRARVVEEFGTGQ